MERPDPVGPGCVLCIGVWGHPFCSQGWQRQWFLNAEGLFSSSNKNPLFTTCLPYITFVCWEVGTPSAWPYLVPTVCCAGSWSGQTKSAGERNGTGERGAGWVQEAGEWEWVCLPGPGAGRGWLHHCQALPRNQQKKGFIDCETPAFLLPCSVTV